MTPSPRASRRARKRRITPEDLLRIVLVGDPQVSPDGSRILFQRKHQGDKNETVANLWMVPAAGGDPVPFTGGGKDGRGRWSADGSRIAFVRSSKDGGAQVFTIPADGGEAVALTSFPEGSIGTLAWSPDGTRIAVSFREADPDWTKEAKKKREEKGLTDPPRVIEDPWYRLDGDGYFLRQRYRLYVVVAATGAPTPVFGDTLGFFTFDWSPDSRQLAIAGSTSRRALYDASKDALFRYDVRSGKLSKIPNLPDGPKTHVAWSPDGKLLAYAGRRGKEGIYSPDNLALWVCDPAGGKARCLTGDEDYCLLATTLSDTSEAAFDPTFRWAPGGKRIYLLLGWHGESHVASVEAAGGKVAWHTHGVYDHDFGNLSRDGKTFALTGASPTRLSEVVVGRLKGGRIEARPLTQFNQALLGELDLAQPRSTWVATPDGTRVQTWVMLPPGASPKKKRPAVLEIHGGPHAQYGSGFFLEFQVLAAAGYAVFYSNPRGSKGYGRDHTAAIRGSWGGADWVDIQAVVEFMKKQPYVDPKRMGIMGGSYGGYMTNWAIGHTDAFAGAITDRCVSNLVSMGGNSDFPITPDLYWKGNFWDRPEDLWDQSPIRYMGNAKTPTLIIHSEGDLRCNIEQSEQVYTLLTYKNVPARFVRYPRSTSHGMSRGGPADMRLHRLGQILGWWGKWLK